MTLPRNFFALSLLLVAHFSLTAFSNTGGFNFQQVQGTGTTTPISKVNSGVTEIDLVTLPELTNYKKVALVALYGIENGALFRQLYDREMNPIAIKEKYSGSVLGFSVRYSTDGQSNAVIAKNSALELQYLKKDGTYGAMPPGQVKAFHVGLTNLGKPEFVYVIGAGGKLKADFVYALKLAPGGSPVGDYVEVPGGRVKRLYAGNNKPFGVPEFIPQPVLFVQGMNNLLYGQLMQNDGMPFPAPSCYPADCNTYRVASYDPLVDPVSKTEIPFRPINFPAGTMGFYGLTPLYSEGHRLSFLMKFDEEWLPDDGSNPPLSSFNWLAENVNNTITVAASDQPVSIFSRGTGKHPYYFLKTSYYMENAIHQIADDQLMIKFGPVSASYQPPGPQECDLDDFRVPVLAAIGMDGVVYFQKYLKINYYICQYAPQFAGGPHFYKAPFGN